MATTFTERLIQPASTTYTLISGSTNNALGNNSLSIGSAFNHLSGTSGLDGAPSGWLVLTYSMTSSPTAGNSISVWFLGAQDHGTNALYEDGGSGVGPTPDRPPDVIFPVATTSSFHQIEMPVFMKVGWQKALLKNQTGIAFS